MNVTSEQVAELIKLAYRLGKASADASTATARPDPAVLKHTFLMGFEAGQANPDVPPPDVDVKIFDYGNGYAVHGSATFGKSVKGCPFCHKPDCDNPLQCALTAFARERAEKKP